MPTTAELAEWRCQLELAALIPLWQRVEGDGRDAGANGAFGRALALPSLRLPLLCAPVRGWTLIEEYLVDATGVAEDDAHVMSIRQLVAEVGRWPECGWAIRAASPGCALVGRYVPASQTGGPRHDAGLVAPLHPGAAPAAA